VPEQTDNNLARQQMIVRLICDPRHGHGHGASDSESDKLTEVHQTVHLKEFTDFPKKDEKDPTMVFTDIHFKKKSIAYEAYHLSHGFCQ